MYGIIVNDLVLDRSYPHPVGSTRTDKTFYRYRAHAELYYGTVELYVYYRVVPIAIAMERIHDIDCCGGVNRPGSVSRAKKRSLAMKRNTACAAPGNERGAGK